MISFQELKTAVHQALRAWHKTDFDVDNPLNKLILVQAEQDALAGRSGLDSAHPAINTVLLHALEALGKQNKLFEDILRKRFLDQETSRQVGYQLNFSEDSINRRQAMAIEQLAEIIWLREENARQEYTQSLEEQLAPKSYSQLFGIEDVIRTLENMVLEVGEPWLISLTGIGGIGKTALADQVLRRSIKHLHFKQIAFVRAEPFSMSGRSESPKHTFEQITFALCDALGIEGPAPDRANQIRRRLKARPHLIIIDNIENAEDASILFSRVVDWVEPTKIIITSRSRPMNVLATRTISLSELPLESALDLVRHEAKIRGIEEVSIAPDHQLAPLYETLGGNPLALKLAVALLEIMPLPTIISDLRGGHSPSTKEMYKHIYWKAWHSLSMEAQSLLEAMPLVGEVGGTQEHLQAITKLTEGKLWQAIQELTARSLLEMRGTAWERRYGIHRLTKTFLNSEIIDRIDKDKGDG